MQMANYLWMECLPYWKICNEELKNEFTNSTEDWKEKLMNNELRNYLENIAVINNLDEIGCKYYSVKNLNNQNQMLKEMDTISVFHLNIRSFNCHHRALSILLSDMEVKFDLIVLSEIWSINIEFLRNIIQGYTLLYDLPTKGSVGGIGLFVKDNIKYKARDDLALLKTINNNDLIENKWIEVEKNGTVMIVGGIYRHPGGDIKKFSDTMDEKMKEINREKN